MEDIGVVKKMKIRITEGVAGIHLLEKIEVIKNNKVIFVKRSAYQKVQSRWTKFGCNWYGENGSVEDIELFEKHLKTAINKKVRELKVTKTKIENRDREEVMVLYVFDEVFEDDSPFIDIPLKNKRSLFRT